VGRILDWMRHCAVALDDGLCPRCGRAPDLLSLTWRCPGCGLVGMRPEPAASPGIPCCSHCSLLNGNVPWHGQVQVAEVAAMLQHPHGQHHGPHPHPRRPHATA